MKNSLTRKPQLTIVENISLVNTEMSSIPSATVIPLKLKTMVPVFNEEIMRWLSSLVIVVLFYSLPLIWWLLPNDYVGVPTPPPAAMVVEVALVPSAPPSKPDLAPGPEQDDTPPPKLNPKPLPEPEPEVPSAVKSEVVVKPKPEIKQPEKPIPEEEQVIEEEPEGVTRPENTVSSTASSPPKATIKDEKSAAPNRGVSTSTVQNNQKLTWQNELMIKLNEAKRYPSRARRSRQEGVGYLRFSMDREGNVLSKNIEQTSGHELLDEETLALIDRALPLPIPPAHIEDASLEFVVPIVFSLRN